jgi:hypothetical protein
VDELGHDAALIALVREFSAAFAISLARRSGVMTNGWFAAARVRKDRTSSRCLEDWETSQPVFSVIFGDYGSLADFPTAQPPRFEFLVCFCSVRSVAFAELGNTHCSLAGTPLPFSF